MDLKYSNQIIVVKVVNGCCYLTTCSANLSLQLDENVLHSRLFCSNPDLSLTHRKRTFTIHISKEIYNTFMQENETIMANLSVQLKMCSLTEKFNA